MVSAAITAFDTRLAGKRQVHPRRFARSDSRGEATEAGLFWHCEPGRCGLIFFHESFG